METAQKKIAIGIQDFSSLIQNGYFYIDKTEFIREWMGKRRQRHFAQPPQTFWKNPQYEHGRTVFFLGIC